MNLPRRESRGARPMRALTRLVTRIEHELPRHPKRSALIYLKTDDVLPGLRSKVRRYLGVDALAAVILSRRQAQIDVNIVVCLPRVRAIHILALARVRVIGVHE